MKKLSVLLLVLMLVFTTACGAKPATEPATTPDTSVTDPAAPVEGETTDPATDPAAPAEGETTDPAAEQTYTGVLQEIKDGMIVVGPDGVDADAFVFGVTEAPTAKVGDTVIVTYTGDMADVGGELNAIRVEVAA
ncbi:MAG: hypothetical protein RRY95_00775 [Oscillospiraceae bacterium]